MWARACPGVISHTLYSTCSLQVDVCVRDLDLIYLFHQRSDRPYSELLSTAATHRELLALKVHSSDIAWEQKRTRETRRRSIWLSRRLLLADSLLPVSAKNRSRPSLRFAVLVGEKLALPRYACCHAGVVASRSRHRLGSEAGRRRGCSDERKRSKAAPAAEGEAASLWEREEHREKAGEAPQHSHSHYHRGAV